MDLFCIYLFQTLPVPRAAGSHAGTRAHAGARTSTRPEDDEAARSARPTGGGQERSRDPGKDAARSRGYRARLARGPARIGQPETARELLFERLCASFVRFVSLWCP